MLFIVVGMWVNARSSLYIRHSVSDFLCFNEHYLLFCACFANELRTYGPIFPILTQEREKCAASETQTTAIGQTCINIVDAVMNVWQGSSDSGDTYE